MCCVVNELQNYNALTNRSAYNREAPVSLMIFT